MTSSSFSLSYGSFLIILAAFLWALEGLLHGSLYSLPID